MRDKFKRTTSFLLSILILFSSIAPFGQAIVNAEGETSVVEIEWPVNDGEPDSTVIRSSDISFDGYYKEDNGNYVINATLKIAVGISSTDLDAIKLRFPPVIETGAEMFHKQIDRVEVYSKGVGSDWRTGEYLEDQQAFQWPFYNINNGLFPTFTFGRTQSFETKIYLKDTFDPEKFPEKGQPVQIRVLASKGDNKFVDDLSENAASVIPNWTKFEIHDMGWINSEKNRFEYKGPFNPTSYQNGVKKLEGLEELVRFRSMLGIENPYEKLYGSEFHPVGMRYKLSPELADIIKRGTFYMDYKDGYGKFESEEAKKGGKIRTNNIVDNTIVIANGALIPENQKVNDGSIIYQNSFENMLDEGSGFGRDNKFSQFVEFVIDPTTEYYEPNIKTLAFEFAFTDTPVKGDRKVHDTIKDSVGSTFITIDKTNKNPYVKNNSIDNVGKIFDTDTQIELGFDNIDAGRIEVYIGDYATIKPEPWLSPRNSYTLNLTRAQVDETALEEMSLSQFENSNLLFRDDPIEIRLAEKGHYQERIVPRVYSNITFVDGETKTIIEGEPSTLYRGQEGYSPIPLGSKMDNMHKKGDIKVVNNEGQIFMGWFTEKNGEGEEFTKETKFQYSDTVYAHWVPYYDVKFIGSEEDGTDKVVYVPKNETISQSEIPDMPKVENKNFSGWRIGEEDDTILLRNASYEDISEKLIKVDGVDTLNVYPCYSDLPSYNINFKYNPTDVEIKKGAEAESLTFKEPRFVEDETTTSVTITKAQLEAGLYSLDKEKKFKLKNHKGIEITLEGLGSETKVEEIEIIPKDYKNEFKLYSTDTGKTISIKDVTSSIFLPLKNRLNEVETYTFLDQLNREINPNKDPYTISNSSLVPEGFIFKGWRFDYSDVVSDGRNIVLELEPLGDKTYVILLERIYPVEYKDIEDCHVDGDLPQRYFLSRNDDITMIPEKPGYKFTKWKIDLVEKDSSGEKVIDSKSNRIFEPAPYKSLIETYLKNSGKDPRNFKFVLTPQWEVDYGYYHGDIVTNVVSPGYNAETGYNGTITYETRVEIHPDAKEGDKYVLKRDNDSKADEQRIDENIKNAGYFVKNYEISSQDLNLVNPHVSFYVFENGEYELKHDYSTSLKNNYTQLQIELERVFDSYGKYEGLKKYPEVESRFNEIIEKIGNYETQQEIDLAAYNLERFAIPNENGEAKAPPYYKDLIFEPRDEEEKVEGEIYNYKVRDFTDSESLNSIKQPKLKSMPGYKFTGWEFNSESKKYIAQYENRAITDSPKNLVLKLEDGIYKISGNAEENSIIRLKKGEVNVGNEVTTVNGEFSIEVPSKTFSHGETIEVTAQYKNPEEVEDFKQESVPATIIMDSEGPKEVEGTANANESTIKLKAPTDDAVKIELIIDENTTLTIDKDGENWPNIADGKIVVNLENPLSESGNISTVVYDKVGNKTEGTISITEFINITASISTTPTKGTVLTIDNEENVTVKYKIGEGDYTEFIDGSLGFEIPDGTVIKVKGEKEGKLAKEITLTVEVDKTPLENIENNKVESPEYNIERALNSKIEEAISIRDKSRVTQKEINNNASSLTTILADIEKVKTLGEKISNAPSPMTQAKYNELEAEIQSLTYNSETDSTVDKEKLLAKLGEKAVEELVELNPEVKKINVENTDIIISNLDEKGDTLIVKVGEEIVKTIEKDVNWENTNTTVSGDINYNGKEVKAIVKNSKANPVDEGKESGPVLYDTVKPAISVKQDEAEVTEIEGIAKEEIELKVEATDNVNLESFIGKIGEDPVTITEGKIKFTSETSGNYNLVLTAVDSVGNTTEKTVVLSISGQDTKYNVNENIGKVKVDDPNNLSEEEKAEIIKRAKSKNNELPNNTSYEIDGSDLVVTFPDNSAKTIPVSKLVVQKDSGKYPLSELEPKVKVNNINSLTTEEKSEVESKIQEQINGSNGTVKVGDDGSVTVTYLDETKNSLEGSKTVTYKDLLSGDDVEKPDGYIVVEFLAGTNGTLEGTTKFYINPKTKSDLRGITPPTIKANVGWTVNEEKWSPTFSESNLVTGGEDQSYTAQYTKVEDILPGNEEKPEDYVTVTFAAENGILEGQTSYHVNPEIEPKKTVGDLTKPRVTANTGWKFLGTWDVNDGTEITEDLTVNANFTAYDNVITAAEGVINPANYVTVIFVVGEGGTLSGDTIYYVNPEANIKVRELNKPNKSVSSDYLEKGWNPDDETIIDKDMTISLILEKKDSVKYPLSELDSKVEVTNLGELSPEEKDEIKQKVLDQINSSGVNSEDIIVDDEGNVTVNFKDGSKGTLTKDKTVVQREFNDESIKTMSIVSDPNNMTYFVDDELSLVGLKIKLVDQYNLEKIVTYDTPEFNSYSFQINPSGVLTIVDNGEYITIGLGNNTTTTTSKLIVKSLNEKYSPTGKNITVNLNETLPEAKEVIENANELPADVQYEYEGTISTNEEKTESINIKVTYNDSSFDTVSVNVTVVDNRLNSVKYPLSELDSKVEVINPNKLTIEEKNSVKEKVKEKLGQTPYKSIEVDDKGNVKVTYNDNSFNELSSSQTVEKKPENKIYKPIGKTIEVELNTEVDPKSLVEYEGLTPIDEIYEFVEPVDTSKVGTKNVEIKVTYKDGTFETLTAKLEVLDSRPNIIENPEEGAPKEGYYRITFNSGENGEFSTNAITKFDVKANSEFPETKAPKVQGLNGYSFTGWDVSFPIVINENKTINATYKAPTKAELYNGSATATVEKDEEFNLSNLIFEPELPTGATFDGSVVIDTSTTGEVKGTILVTFSDDSTKLVPYVVTVTESEPEEPEETEADNYNGSAKATVEKDTAITEDDLIFSPSLPNGSTIIIEELNVDTSTVGEKVGTIRVKFSDNSEKDISYTITVIESEPEEPEETESDNYSGSATATVEKDSTITKDDLIFSPSLPNDSKIIEELNIDTSTVGKKVGTIRVKFSDNSEKDISYIVIVTEDEESEIPEEKSDSEKYPISELEEKVKVENPTELTEQEKEAIKEAIKSQIKDANVLDENIIVDNDGSVTVIYNDGTINTLKVSETVIRKPVEPKPIEPKPEYRPNDDYISNMGWLIFGDGDSSKGESSKIEPTPNTNSEEVKPTPIENKVAYVEGYPDGTIRPNGQITRAEAAAMIARLLDLPLDDKSETEYKDSPSSWYNEYINAVTKAGIMEGYPDGTFKPDAPITRGEFATMISNFDKMNSGSNDFEDVNGHWAENAIDQAVANHRVEGYPDGTFKPNGEITRAEAATILNRTFERSMKNMSEAQKNLLKSMDIYTDLTENHWGYYEMLEATNKVSFK